MSDRHSIAMTDFRTSDRSLIALGGSTQTLTTPWEFIKLHSHSKTLKSVSVSVGKYIPPPKK